MIFCLASVNTMQNGNAAERPDDGGGEYVSSYNGVGSGLGSGSEVQQHRVRHSLGDPPLPPLLSDFSFPLFYCRLSMSFSKKGRKSKRKRSSFVLWTC